jgi:hypothetical protein
LAKLEAIPFTPQCYIYLMYISYFTSKCQNGCLDIIQQ